MTKTFVILIITLAWPLCLHTHALNIALPEKSPGKKHHLPGWHFKACYAINNVPVTPTGDFNESMILSEATRTRVRTINVSITSSPCAVKERNILERKKHERASIRIVTGLSL